MSVATYRVPCGWMREDVPVPYTFVTNGIEIAVEQARAAAREGWVGVTGTSTGQQRPNTVLIDEIRVTLLPVVLGCGIRQFGCARHVLTAGW